MVASIIRVEPDALTADALGLVDAQAPVAPPLAAAPAVDPVSAGAAEILEAHSGSLATVVEHSGSLRAHGGAVLSQAAAALRNADDENAALIAAVIGGTAPTTAPSVSALSVPPAPPGVMLPELPAMTPPPMLPGEQFSALIHRGEGSGALLDFADTWRAHAARLDDLADQVLHRSAAIDEHWIDGAQQAGANTREHGAWLRGSADQAHKIASVTTDVADEFDAAKRATPTPEEFDEARAEYINAQARRDPIGAAQAAQKYATMQDQATEAAESYHAGVSAATYRLGEPLKTAPPISRTGFQPLGEGIGGEEDDPYTGAPSHEPQPKTPLPTPFDPKTGAANYTGGGEGGEVAEPVPLPNASKAVIDPRKFADYSMDQGNPNNAGKWTAWRDIGYDVNTTAGRAAATDDVIAQLGRQLAPGHATYQGEFPGGPRYEMDTIINGPSGQGTLKTIWQIEDGVPRLITNWLKVHQ